MENNGLSVNDRKVLSYLLDCVKVDIPALAEKTSLSKPTVRTIVNKLISSEYIFPSMGYVPWKLGLDIMTVYEITYPPSMHGEKLVDHLKSSLITSTSSAIVMRINPSQALVIAFYASLEHKDFSFSRMMHNLSKTEGRDFQPIIKELCTRPSKDFFYDTHFKKFLKGLDDFQKYQNTGNNNSNKEVKNNGRISTARR